jgi:hypothetical protein
MDQKQKRRWFRFRLSTLLILIAIAAWGTVYPPFETVTIRTQQQARVSEFQVLKLSEVGVLPIIALAIFITWKAASVVVERRFAQPV